MTSTAPLRTALAAALLLVVCAGTGCSEAASENRDEVVVYSSADSYVARPVFDAFTEETGIEVRYLGDTEATKTVGLVEKLRAERAAPRADVFWSSDAYQLAALAPEGLFAELDDRTLEGWPESRRSAESLWIEFAARARVIVYNTELVQQQEIPRGFHELADHRWAGRTVMARPEFGTTRAHVGAIVALWGEQGFEGWLRAMKDNGLRIVDGNATVVREVASGRALVGLTDTDDVWSGQRNGMPVDAVSAHNDVDSDETVTHGTMVIANAASVVRGGPNPDAAQRFVAFLVSERVERLLAETDSHNIPIRPGLSSSYPEYELERPLELSVERVIDAIPVALRLCREIL